MSVLQGSADTLFRRGGKTNQLVIPSSLSNVCAKNYSNRKMFAQITAKNVGDVFFLRHSVCRRDLGEQNMKVTVDWFSCHKAE